MILYILIAAIALYAFIGVGFAIWAVEMTEMTHWWIVLDILLWPISFMVMVVFGWVSLIKSWLP